MPRLLSRVAQTRLCTIRRVDLATFSTPGEYRPFFEPNLPKMSKTVVNDLYPNHVRWHRRPIEDDGGGIWVYVQSSPRVCMKLTRNMR
jgi:hypothetical protein